jgi:hypothetical protein
MRRLRERRARLIEPGDGRAMRAGADLLLPAVESALSALELAGRDAAAAQLARSYAAAVDEAQDQAAALARFGPLLLKSLVALGATPLSRAPAEKRGQLAAGRPSWLDEHRAARAKRGRL